jgi:single-strand DNA-binding protein
MPGYEQTIVVGNVGRDVEVKQLNGGATVSSFTVAVTTRWTDRNSQEKRERTTWYRVSCWNRLGEIAAQYVKKGTQIMVVGTVTANAFMGQDGEPRASLELRAETFQLLGGGGGSGGSGGSGGYDDYAPPPQELDDIPF